MGASRVIGIDRVPERLARAENTLQIETIDFAKHKDVVKRIYEMVPDGLHVALDCGKLFYHCRIYHDLILNDRDLPRA